MCIDKYIHFVLSEVPLIKTIIDHAVILARIVIELFIVIELIYLNNLKIVLKKLWKLTEKTWRNRTWILRLMVVIKMC